MEKKSLIRKANTTAHGNHYRGKSKKGYVRGSKRVKEFHESGQYRMKILRAKPCDNFDVTPLIKFIQKNVGRPVDEVKSEAKSRFNTKKNNGLTKQNFEKHWNHIVNNNYICIYECTFFSGVYVDDDGILQPSSENHPMKFSFEGYYTYVEIGGFGKIGLYPFDTASFNGKTINIPKKRPLGKNFPKKKISKERNIRWNFS